jgi:hypothetical protein
LVVVPPLAWVESLCPLNVRVVVPSAVALPIVSSV